MLRKTVSCLLPVMVGYDGSQRSHTYSVAHQMDFLTQNVFKPARRKQQDDSLSASLRSFEKPKVLPSVWQQPDYRGEEDKQADTGEGQSYPGEDGKKNTITQQPGARNVIGASLLLKSNDNRLQDMHGCSQTANR